MVADYRKQTLDVLDFVARKVDADVIEKYKPEKWSFYSTGTPGTPDEHPTSDIDLKLNMSRKTLNKHEEKIGRYCIDLITETKEEHDFERDITIWLQEIEDFKKKPSDFRLYACNATLKYGTDQERLSVKPSDYPSPITNKLLLAQWAMKDRLYHDATFLGGSENTLELVRRDRTLWNSIRWEGYEMAVRGMCDLVIGLSSLESLKTSKAVHRLAHSLHVSLGRPFLTDYKEIVEASHGLLADYPDYEELVSQAGKIRDAWRGERVLNYDFNDAHFQNTLLDFAMLCRSETQEVARREGYFLMPERVACMDYYINSFMAPVARSITSGASVAKEFSELLSAEVVDLLIRYDRTFGDANVSFSTPSPELMSQPWVRRLQKIGAAPKLKADEVERLKAWLSGASVTNPAIKGKIFLANGDKTQATEKLDEAIAAVAAGKGEGGMFSYTLPNEYVLAELYVCRADATDNDEEAAEFYEKALRENAFNPYCWYRLGNIRNLPHYRDDVANLVSQAMQGGKPWDAFNRLYFDPHKMDEKAVEIWEDAHQKRLKRFARYAEHLEAVAKEHAAKSDDELGEENYQNFAKTARDARDAILQRRAKVAKAIYEFLKEMKSPLFGTLLDRFENYYDAPSRRYAEKAEMSRRKVVIGVLSGDFGEERRKR